MKITVDINGKPTEIELTEEQVASIEAQNKPKKFEWKYPRGDTFFVANDYVSSGCYGESKDYREQGRYRLTEKAAEQSLLRNKRANRLEALAEQLGGIHYEWDACSSNYIYLESKSQEWWFAKTPDYEPEKVYMTEECAREICRMLNEGEFSLDGELL